MRRLAIIIPTLNERGSLPMLFDEIGDVAVKARAQGYDIEVVIVDDSSTDGTQHFVREFQSRDLFPITLVEREKRGLATAVLRGFQETNAPLLCVMDADLSHPPAVILQALPHLNDYDVVLPSRNIPGGGAEEWPLHRRTTSIIATKIASLVTDVSDPMSGYFFLHRHVIGGVILDPIGYKILLEILVKGNVRTKKEIPYVFRNRVVGASKMTSRIIFQYLKHLWHLFFWKRKNGS